MPLSSPDVMASAGLYEITRTNLALALLGGVKWGAWLVLVATNI